MNKSMEKAEDAGPGYIVRSHGFSACIINPDGSGTDTVYANMSMFADGSCHIECYVDGIRVLSKNIGTEDLMLFQTQDGDSSITAEHVIQKVSITDVDCSGVMLRMTLGRPRTRKGASCYTVYVDNIKGIDGIMPEDRIDIDFGDPYIKEKRAGLQDSLYVGWSGGRGMRECESYADAANSVRVYFSLLRNGRILYPSEYEYYRDMSCHIGWYIGDRCILDDKEISVPLLMAYTDLQDCGVVGYDYGIIDAWIVSADEQEIDLRLVVGIPGRSGKRTVCVSIDRAGDIKAHVAEPDRCASRLPSNPVIHSPDTTSISVPNGYASMDGRSGLPGPSEDFSHLAGAFYHDDTYQSDFESEQCAYAIISGTEADTSVVYLKLIDNGKVYIDSTRSENNRYGAASCYVEWYVDGQCVLPCMVINVADIEDATDGRYIIQRASIADAAPGGDVIKLLVTIGLPDTDDVVDYMVSVDRYGKLSPMVVHTYY